MPIQRNLGRFHLTTPVLCVLFVLGCGQSEPKATHLPAKREPPVVAEGPEIKTLPAQLALARPGAANGRRTPDPRAEGWSTEAFNEEAGRQLKTLGKLLQHSEKLDTAHLTPIVAEDFSCGSLYPDHLDKVFNDNGLLVERGKANLSSSLKFRGESGLISALSAMLAPLESGSDIHVKFKLYQVDASDSSSIVTRQYFAISGRIATGMLEQNATWQIHWKPGSADQAPQIESIVLEQFEQVTTRTTAGPLFADRTVAVIGSTPAFKQQLRYGNAYWRQRIESYHHIYQFGYNGLAIGDINGDGLDDIYHCQAGGLPNRLFVQLPDGTTREMSYEAGVDFLDNTRSCLLIDLDNDGDQDMAVSLVTALLLLENDGAGHFKQRIAMKPVRNSFSLAAADYDQDGDLDIYACTYYAKGDDASEFPVPMPFFNANNGGENFLIRNDGDWLFSNATAESQLNVNNRRFSFAAAWDDVDGDGDQDLCVANDFGRKSLFRNDAGKFVDVASEMGLNDESFGMSVSMGDYNRDGKSDIYFGNMFSAAGNRVTTQPKFKRQASAKLKERFRRLARGNSLFAGDGDRFRDKSIEAGVTMGRWSWSSLFADINNDGWEDLLVANGFLTGDQSGDL